MVAGGPTDTGCRVVACGFVKPGWSPPGVCSDFWFCDDGLATELVLGCSLSDRLPTVEVSSIIDLPVS